MTYPSDLNASDRDIFDAVLVGLLPREAAFVRNYFANGQVAADAARQSGYSCGGCSAKNAGYRQTHRSLRISAAIRAINRLISRRTIPSLPAAEVDATLAAIPGLRPRQAGFVRQYFAHDRDADAALAAAGYANPARGTGRRQLMSKPPVRAAIGAIDDLLCGTEAAPIDARYPG